MSIFIRTFACMKKNISHTNLVTTTKALLHVVSLLSAPLLLTAAILMAACSSDDANDTPTPTNDNAEICFTVAPTTWYDATRATTYDNTAAIQAEPQGFVCFAYKDGTAEPYDGIDNTSVCYETDHWAFQDGTTHRWPDYPLNFFCIMPAGLANTPCLYDYAAYDPSSNPDGYSEDTPRITCADIPVAITAGSADYTKELIYAYTPNQSKYGPEGRNGVTLTFRHPFARVYFKLSAASGPDVKVNKITIPGIYRNGLCTINGAANPQTSVWSNLSHPENFVLSAPSSGVATDDDTPYIVIPNNYGTKTFTVNATWTEWGDEVTADISADVTVNWEAGRSYTYTLTITKYALTVDTEKFTEQW